MEDFKVRVLEEKRQLDEKVSALSAFTQTAVFFSLNNQDQILLVEQLNAMEAYSLALSKRIERF